MSEHDPHPLVVTEGGSFGLPVIVSDRVGCIGPHDTARPGINAVVYPLGDVEGFADAIISLAKDAPLRERLGQGSLAISATQDVSVAADALGAAAETFAGSGRAPGSRRDGRMSGPRGSHAAVGDAAARTRGPDAWRMKMAPGFSS